MLEGNLRTKRLSCEENRISLNIYYNSVTEFVRMSKYVNPCKHPSELPVVALGLQLPDPRRFHVSGERGNVNSSPPSAKRRP